MIFPIGVPELLLLLIVIIVIFGLTKLSRLRDGLNDGFERLMRRKIYVAGRIDSDDRFRTEDWREPVAGGIGNDKHRRKIFWSFVVGAIGIVVVFLVAVWAGIA